MSRDKRLTYWKFSECYGTGKRGVGKMVRWSKRRGWQVGPTPYQYRIRGLHFFQRGRFKGLRP